MLDHQEHIEQRCGYVDKRTRAIESSDQRPTDSSDTMQHPTTVTPPALLEPDALRAFSAALWLPTETADRGSLMEIQHTWLEPGNTAAHSWFCYEPHRGIAQPGDLPRLRIRFSRGAGHDRAQEPLSATKQQAGPDTRSLSRPQARSWLSPPG